ncbi:MAG TPA: MoxR family ATPase [Phycisphaerales bacterium]|nr:MoxR family ATPase [Phycisphaerales bacterium]HMP36887.1 MoxR family ATPase [Phycisphaerales bacterium]
MPSHPFQQHPFERIHDRDVTRLPKSDRFGEAGHRWSESEIEALVFAWAAGRPLLVRGEAGCGKSQIARAAAAVMGSGEPFCEVIHPRFEALDLLYRFDVVERLADAQVERLDETNERYVKRGALWQAIDAVSDSGPTPVLLVDEIDKADADLPNALLEVLGNRSFVVPHLKEKVNGVERPLAIAPKGGLMPLIIITTNEERELPPAFVRRCAVLNLNPPQGDAEFMKWLRERSEAHTHLHIDGTVRERAAKQVLEDRKECEQDGYPTVGLAEYLDLLHALHALTRDLDPEGRRSVQLDWLDKLGRYALVKHPKQDQRRAPVGDGATEQRTPKG